MASAVADLCVSALRFLSERDRAARSPRVVQMFEVPFDQRSGRNKFLY